VSGFETIVVVDWSARSSPSPKRETADAIWIGVATGGEVTCSYHRTRAAAMRFLTDLFEAERAAGRRVLAGFDFPFAYPEGFCRRVTGSDDPLALWVDLATRIEDADDNANNRWQVAAELNDLFPGVGPFWGCPVNVTDPRLPHRGNDRHDHGMTERRDIERHLPGAQPCWKLYTTGSVGSQALLGIPRLQALRDRFGADLSVRPFETRETPITLVELFPSLIASTIADLQDPEEIKDRAQVRVLAQALAALDPDLLDAMTREGDRTEGWILGHGHEATLDKAARDPSEGKALEPPPLRNDCFALPPGVDWTPVDDALAHLRDNLHAVVSRETVPLADAMGRVLAAPVTAARANPPHANAAVDGYGFSGGVPEGETRRMPLLMGRAAAGAPFDGAVPEGHALRILTGAPLPTGVDTVVLEEDVTLGDGEIAFRGHLKPGANARAAGEDVVAGQDVLPAGRLIGAADLALLSAIGATTLEVHRPLRVALLSTGDELVEPGGTVGPGQIGDANRPMLRAMVQAWGFVAVDLGIAPDDRAAVSAAFDRARAEADMLITSGGASAGDEDHVSALLRAGDAMQMWRIAVKPGRPLALGLWSGMPVFGLPGNPVAAMVCTAIFARPALQVLSGQGWQPPQGFTVPAAFTKAKKPGRREYLRARLRDGAAEVFASEGSGRISGLSWAEGLVELPDGPRDIAPGTPVTYYPWSSFGL
jgi:molybdopterin molybdotransferase